MGKPIAAYYGSILIQERSEQKCRVFCSDASFCVELPPELFPCLLFPCPMGSLVPVGGDVFIRKFNDETLSTATMKRRQR